MPTECSADRFGFAAVAGHAVVAALDGGKMTSDAGALLLGATDRAIGLIDRFAACFTDAGAPDLIEHTVRTLVGQRIVALALGYEELIDHDERRHDPAKAVLAGKLSARRKDGAPLAGKSTLKRLARGGRELTRYHRIAWEGGRSRGCLSICSWKRMNTRQSRSSSTSTRPTTRCTGIRKAAFFHGYDDCYCYLPLYIYCGQHVLAAKLRPR